MNRLRAITTRPNQEKAPFQKKQDIKDDMSSSARRRHLNIVSPEVIDEYLHRQDLDMNNQNDSEVIIKLLKKSTKSVEDIEIILKVFNKISFFQDLQRKIPITHIRQLIKQFKYEYKERGDIVFQYGEFGTNYYILLKGSLYLLLPKSTLQADYEPEKEKPPQFLTEPQNSSANIMKTPSNKQMLEKEKPPQFLTEPQSANIMKTPSNKQMLLDESKATPKSSRLTPKKDQRKGFSPRKSSKFNLGLHSLITNGEQELIGIIRQMFPDFHLAKTLEAVTGFGEIALNSNLKRTATIVCRENCHLVTLSKSNYEKILKEHHESIVQSKVAFLKNFSFCSEWNTSKILSMWELLRLQTLPRNSNIYKEGDEAKCIYFVKSGEIELSKVFQLFDESPSLAAYQSKAHQRHSLNDINPIWAHSRFIAHFRRIKVFAAFLTLIPLKLALLGPGSYFGEEEVLIDSLRSARATVISASAEIFKCPKEKLFAYVKTAHNMQLLQDDVDNRLEWRAKHVEIIRKISQMLKETTDAHLATPLKQTRSPLKSSPGYYSPTVRDKSLPEGGKFIPQRDKSLAKPDGNKSKNSSPFRSPKRSPYFNRSSFLGEDRYQRSKTGSRVGNRGRIGSFLEEKADLRSLEDLEKLHNRMKNILKIRKMINRKSDQEQCQENSLFLNSLLQEHNQRLCLIEKKPDGNERKVIAVVKKGSLTSRPRNYSQNTINPAFKEKDTRRACRLASIVGSPSKMNRKRAAFLKEGRSEKDCFEPSGSRPERTRFFILKGKERLAKRGLFIELVCLFNSSV